MMVGRAVDQVFPKRDAADRRAGAHRCRPFASDRIRRHLLRAAQGRDPRLLRPGRRRPQRSHAGALRHHPHDSRHDHAGRQHDRAASRRRCHRRRHRLCAGGARQAGRRHRPADLPERVAAVARHALELRLPAGSPRSSRWRAPIPSGSTCAPPRSARMSARCRAATSRRWSSPNGWRRRRRSSSSTSRPRASISAPRRPCTASWANSPREGCPSSWSRPNSRRSSACPTASSSCAKAGSPRVYDNEGLDAETLVRDGARGSPRDERCSNIARSGWSLAIVAADRADLAALSGLRRPGNLGDVFNDTSILIILALGQMAVILTRSIDLSMAANLAFTGMVGRDDQCRLSRHSRPAADRRRASLIGARSARSTARWSGSSASRRSS